MNLKSIGLAVGGLFAVLGLLAFLGVHLGGAKPQVAGSSGNASETYYNSQWLVGGNQIGPTGTLNANSQFGRCALIAPSYSVTASSSASMDCAVPGILAGDVVVGMFATSTVAAQGWEIVGASASSTSGYITFRVANDTGATNVIPASLASTTQYATWR